jgi:hypothetical protein
LTNTQTPASFRRMYAWPAVGETFSVPGDYLGGMSRPVNPSFMRWLAIAFGLAGVGQLLLFTFGEHRILNGGSAALWLSTSALWVREWRRKQRTYLEWFERGQR